MVLRQGRTMTVHLRWNRLAIEADGDAAFKKDAGTGVAKLVGTPYAAVELDLGRCVNLGEESFKTIGPLIADAVGRKQFTVHITNELEKFFEGSGLSGLVEVNVVEHMEAVIKPASQDDEADLLLPMNDDPLTDDTVPPDDDEGSMTRIQTRASGGTLLDEEDQRTYEIGEEIIIGREPPSNPVFTIPTISKRHFRIYRQGPGYFIEDLRSTNGTYLNGNPLTQPQPLAENDEIVVAITLKHPEGARRFKFVIN
jgi:hypothetical protein